MAPVTSTDIPIAYDDAGAGEPALLFLPGWCTPRTLFDVLVDRCSTRRRTLSLDWRSHGGSGRAAGDFTTIDLLQDALAVIEQSGVREVVPVALSHAGWVAIELRRRLGTRIPKLVFLEWIVTEAPAPFLELLLGLQVDSQWRRTVEQISALWLARVENPKLISYVCEEMGSFGFDMWSRAAREIMAAYQLNGSPLRALASLEPPPRFSTSMPNRKTPTIIRYSRSSLRLTRGLPFRSWRRKAIFPCSRCRTKWPRRWSGLWD